MVSLGELRKLADEYMRVVDKVNTLDVRAKLVQIVKAFMLATRGYEPNVYVERVVPTVDGVVVTFNTGREIVSVTDECIASNLRRAIENGKGIVEGGE